MSYLLVSELHAHTGPVRCLSLGSHGELISGCQADTPSVKRWKLLNTNMSGPRASSSSSSSSSSYSSTSLPGLEALDSEIPHDHWVTACTSLAPGIIATYPMGLFITGCQDSKIRLFDPNTQELILTLEGHKKGVISFSWTSSNQLVSGSWDGSARIWDLDLGGACMMELTGHENGVNVLGLRSGHVLTTSTGESVNGKPANFQLRMWDPSDGKQLGASVEDHRGSIRGICGLAGGGGGGGGGFATCSNDGSVLAYSVDAASGMEVESKDTVSSSASASARDLKSLSSSALKCVSRMSHVATDESHTNFVLACVASGDDQSEIVSCGEDGAVYVWQAQSGATLQRIDLPSCCWCAVSLPGTNGDFLTGSQDGVIRWFSRNPKYAESTAALVLTDALAAEVSTQAAKRKRGPSSEELAKCSPWDDRGRQVKSEGTVMVFNKQGKMIAAQMTSGSWVEIGEVTGSGGSSDSGVVCGEQYDHVMPVEMEGPGGIPRTMQLGFNDKENPFLAAQRFINQNELGQQFLSQIADWILERSGRQETPTIGGGGAVGGNVGNGGAGTFSGMGTPSSVYKAAASGSGGDANPFLHVLVAYKITSDIPPVGKLIAKIQEFCEGGSGDIKTGDLQNVETLLNVLQDTSRYHVSTVRAADVSSLLRLIMSPSLTQEKLFPIFDVARMLALHPSGSVELAKSAALPAVLSRTLDLLLRADTASATALTALRFIGNCFRFDELRSAALLGRDALKTDATLISIIVACHNNCGSTNKSIRAAVANVTCNLALALLSIPEFKSMLYNTQETLLRFLGLVNEQLVKELETLENVFKALTSLGTVAYRGGSLMQDKIKGVSGVVDTKTILAIVESNWAGKSNDLVDCCIRELRALLK